MAAADTARLIASLTLDDKGFSKGLTRAERGLGKLEGTAFRVGQNIGSGVKTGLDNLAKLGVVAAGGIALAVKSGLDDLAELENAITSVDGAIAQLGLTGQVTGKQVADWANQIEADVDAAFDDKAITQAAASLIRFGKVTPKNLRNALEVMTDLAAKTGDIDSAASLLAKALADPTKAAGKLARVGVILTKQQQDQIKAMTEAGDVAGAQAVLLDALAVSTGGAAKAMAGPYQDAINKTNDAIEDAKKALAVGFLPVITKVADKLSTIAADPKALASIKEFGETLAGGLDSLISTAERLPWAAIGTSLQIAGVGAKAVLTAFTSLPPWVQTAVLTGWGLNKLTGGALSGIVGELGKGLIKGVLGMNAGVVNIKAGTVVGAGGVGAAGAAGAVGAGGKGGAGRLLDAASKILIVGLVADIASQIDEAIQPPNQSDMSWPWGPKNTPTILPELFGGNGLLGGSGTVPVENKHLNNMETQLRDSAVRENASNERLEAIKVQQAAGAAKIAAEMPPIRSEMIGVRQSVVSTNARTVAQLAGDSSSERTAIANAASAQQAAQARTTEAARSAAAAIRDKDLSVTTNVNVQQRLSVNNITKAVDTYSRVYRTAS